MTFLNAILLAGGATFLVPLLIHLLNKRRVQTVRWGAMHLLQEVIKQKKRRMNIEQWLLLAVRIAIPIVLALCLARPVLTALRTFGLAKTSLVMMLDDSFSMRAPAPNGSPAERARADTTRILESQPKGSDAQVILSGGNSHTLLPQASRTLDLIPKQLIEVPNQAGPVRVNEALQIAAASMAKTANGARELAILSDFQASDWKSIADGASLPALESILKQEPKPQVTFYRLTSDLTENLSIASADVSALVVAEEQPVGLRARIQNHGTRPWQDVAVHLEADGVRLRTSRVSLPPEGEAVIAFTHAFDTVGDHSLTVRLEGDSFPDDNTFHTIIQVRNQLNVLLVEGDPSLEALGGAADFLELALAPHQSASASLKDLIRTTKVEARRLRDDDYRGKEIVILADVDRLQGNRLNELIKFVQNGGGLVIFGGPHCDVDWYNRELYRQGEGLLPASIKGLLSASNAQPARVLQQRLTHPAMIYFNDSRGGHLQDAAFQSWLNLDTSGQKESKPLLMLDRNSPLFVEKAYERGRVILAATTADAEWSNLPLQPFFVPLMQRMITYLATQDATTAWHSVGTAFRMVLPKERLGVEYTFQGPSSPPLTLKAKSDGDKALLETPAITSPGIYKLTQGNTTRLLAYNLDPAESDLAPLSAEQVQHIADRHQAAFVESFDAWQKLDRTRRHGSELWKPFLLALLALLFFEVLLQQRIARG
ncbi:N-terminal double-transmembrane domain-containing protein [Prosthecobacter debontii]|uniref:N-terminal double-transmembrane domain-containing protein n=1 Tax=Prosthecobacter debontii TaxID=48467 RepID=A0A1T4YZN9_9BACT|nr:BatA domain-containing protein [Prosthecobacter debontii]SKB06725.1 N-terminal double-transmembrane domain-containing protein [Prosthecobacter debontii]